MKELPDCRICGKSKGHIWLRSGFVCGECFNNSREGYEEKIILEASDILKRRESETK